MSAYYGYRNIDTQEIELDAFTVTFDHTFNDHVSVRNLTRYQLLTALIHWLGLKVVVDRLTKILVVEVMDLRHVLFIPVRDPFLNLTMAWNRGINFGLFDFGAAEDGRDIASEIRTRMWPSLALALPALRVFRLARFARAARVARGARLVRLVGSVNRGMNALGAALSRRGFGYVLSEHAHRSEPQS